MLIVLPWTSESCKVLFQKYDLWLLQGSNIQGKSIISTRDITKEILSFNLIIILNLPFWNDAIFCCLRWFLHSLKITFGFEVKLRIRIAPYARVAISWQPFLITVAFRTFCYGGEKIILNSCFNYDNTQCNVVWRNANTLKYFFFF